MYQQSYDPLGNVFLSTLVAAIPILTLLYFIALHRHRDSSGNVHLGIPAPWAALFGVIAAFVVVCLVFHMPVPAAVSRSRSARSRASSASSGSFSRRCSSTR
jgi:lactate permease